MGPWLTALLQALAQLMMQQARQLAAKGVGMTLLMQVPLVWTAWRRLQALQLVLLPSVLLPKLQCRPITRQRAVQPQRPRR